MRAGQTSLNPEGALLESEGQPVSATIVDEANQWGADLLVVGTHSRRGLDRLLFGSVAEDVSRAAAMSVLLKYLGGVDAVPLCEKETTHGRESSVQGSNH